MGIWEYRRGGEKHPTQDGPPSPSDNFFENLNCVTFEEFTLLFIQKQPTTLGDQSCTSLGAASDSFAKFFAPLLLFTLILVLIEINSNSN